VLGKEKPMNLENIKKEITMVVASFGAGFIIAILAYYVIGFPYIPSGLVIGAGINLWRWL
jgi:hypothetical protein